MFREYALNDRYNSILTTNKKMSNKKGRLRLTGEQVIRESLYWILRRTHQFSKKSRLEQFYSFLFGALHSVQQYILKTSWGVRAPNTYPTREVRGLHEPHGVRLRGADFPQYRQIDQRVRKNDIASAPEFPAKRPICTIQYVFRTPPRVMAPGVSNRPSKKQKTAHTAVGL